MSENRYGILIANQDYPEDSGFEPLNCPVHDARALQEVLADPMHGGFTEVLVLADRDRRDILLNIEEFLHKADRDDLVFIYFSGHGKTNRKGNLYFAAHNTKADRLLSTGINAADLSELIRDSRTSKKALVLDCCYAGAFAKGFKGGADVAQDRIDEFSRGSGTYVLMATGELSLAEEDPEQGLSVLTRHMVDGLRGKADEDRDGIITLRELSRYVHRQVIDFHDQKPTEAGLGIQGDVAISKSGIEPDKELRGQIKLRLLEWSQANSITNDVLARALGILDKGLDLETEHERGYRAILDRVISQNLGPGPFLADWFAMQIARPEPKPDPPPKPEPEPETATGPDPGEVSGRSTGSRKEATAETAKDRTTAAFRFGQWAGSKSPFKNSRPVPPNSPNAEAGVLLSIGWLAAGIFVSTYLAYLFDTADLSLSGMSYDDATSGAVIGCFGAAFLGFRRFIRKHASLGWISIGICVLGSMAFVVAGFAFLSTMRF